MNWNTIRKMKSKYKLSDRKRHNKNIDFAKTHLRISGFEI
ncbi:hypothetical protein T12_14209 [Trichinella patagoniensis]|uniref:Uncharacterized protein n=1 Tax=Trichinella patagoniensis TaxID=990121 RepID=A0A0V0WE20_9BILA|nr:hypothetical protein T12_14209 [Trichinella patagoniensis]